MIKSNLKLAFAKFCLAFTLISIFGDLNNWAGIFQNSSSSGWSPEKYAETIIVATILFLSDKIRDYDHRLSSSESQPE
jgi:hypothetical protein